MSDLDSVRPNSFEAWVLASRPKTWLLALSPVLLGLSLSLLMTRRIDIPVALATALLSVLMQAISNMENDAAYTKRKAENGTRRGLPRATSLKLLSVSAVEKAIKVLALIALLDTLFLMYAGGWIIVAITVGSIIAAYFYMGGPKPLAYTPFSELVCFVFFGLVATCGTVYLQTSSVDTNTWICGCILGSVTTAVLVVNNYRDIDHDTGIGRKTLAVFLGKLWTERLYCFLMLCPYVLILVLLTLDYKLYPIALGLTMYPKTSDLTQEIRVKTGYDLNSVLFRTVQLELQLTVLLAVGFTLCFFL